MIREVNKNDIVGLLQLYTQLHNNPMPEIDNTINDLWNKILSDNNHHIIVAEEDN